MPRLMEKDDLMRTALGLGRAQEIWTDTFDTVSGEFSFSLPLGGRYQIVAMRISPLEVCEKGVKKIPYGLMKDKLKNWDYETDQAMDREVCGMFDCLKEDM
ncbi:MAG: hypothetical protein IJQ34_03145 [Kiritimatiellae bacterium]|nr:hypothetical protein [Kiritimatiellia bacterium]